MTPYRITQLLTIALSAATGAMVLILAPEGTAWWKVALGLCFAAGFSIRVASLLRGDGRAAPLTKWLSCLPLLLLALMVLHWPQWWALLGAGAAWTWGFTTRRHWQPQT